MPQYYCKMHSLLPIVLLFGFILAIAPSSHSQTFPHTTNDDRLAGIPSGKTRVLNTGWASRWPDQTRFRNTVHHIALGANLYALENFANLNDLPASGAFLIAAPIKLEGGSGGPCSVFAVLP
ncbi:MAG: hypothetical protein NVS9B4_11610 [Candidatus Acidiferrum sp.]